MFKELSKQLDVCNLSISFIKKGELITAVIVPRAKAKEDLKLSPITMTGSAEEFDKNFVEGLGKLIGKVEQNMEMIIKAEDFDKSIEDAKKPKEKPTKKAPIKKEKGPSVKELTDEGDKLFGEAKYKESLAKYDEALKQKPKDKKLLEKQKKSAQWVKAMSDADLFAEQKDEPSSTDNVPQDIKDVAEASPNVEIVSMPKEEEKSEPEKPQEEDNFGSTENEDENFGDDEVLL